MKIIKSSFQILDFDDNALDKIERAARICYLSEPKNSPEEFVRGLIERGHMTPLEMAHITVKIICDRGVSHELVRHRLASFNQESTRYNNYSKDKFGGELTFIAPSFWSESPLYALWKIAMRRAERTYLQLIKLGAQPQEARSVLPSSLKTEIICSCNLREWLHIFKLRCSEKSHTQMREIMIPLKKEFAKRLPVIFG